MSTTFGLSCALKLGTIASAIVSMALPFFFQHHGPQKKEEDVHTRLYRKYAEVPHWWYFTLFVIMMVLSIIVCERWKKGLPWWGFLITQLIQFVFILPIGMIRANTGVGIGKLIKHHIA